MEFIKILFYFDTNMLFTIKVTALIMAVTFVDILVNVHLFNKDIDVTIYTHGKVYSVLAAILMAGLLLAAIVAKENLPLILSAEAFFYVCLTYIIASLISKGEDTVQEYLSRKGV